MCAAGRCLVVIVVATAASIQAQPQTTTSRRPAPASIAAVSWIAASWEGTADASVIEEHWMSPAGGAMLGVARTISGRRMAAFEFLRIFERDGSLVYIAPPGGRPPVEFTLTAVDAKTATFENPANDFPKRIRYASRADGSLEATISGGAETSQIFIFHRAKR